MKKIRLDEEIYRQSGRPCHITICAEENLSLFVVPEFTCFCMDLLETYCRRYGLFLYVYCFMPDHIHFIATVRGGKSIISLIQAFKSKATVDSRAFDFSGRLFQPRFYDHFPRAMEDLEREINYIMDNPVRKGLAKERGEYPFAKCFV